jgi:hypothetical protein
MCDGKGVMNHGLWLWRMAFDMEMGTLCGRAFDCWIS